MLITAIEREKSKYRVYIDNEYAFSLYIKELERFHIDVNQSIDEETFKKVMDIVKKRGMNYTYHLLSKKDYSERELYTRLLNAGLIEKDIQTILDQLAHKGFINDLNYAKRYFETHYLYKSYKQIVYNLKNKGIDIEIINKALSDNDNKMDEYMAARKITEKRLKGKYLISYEDRCKLYNYLANKGFRHDTIRRVVDNFSSENGE